MIGSLARTLLSPWPLAVSDNHELPRACQMMLIYHDSITAQTPLWRLSQDPRRFDIPCHYPCPNMGKTRADQRAIISVTTPDCAANSGVAT